MKEKKQFKAHNSYFSKSLVKVVVGHSYVSKSSIKSNEKLFSISSYIWILSSNYFDRVIIIIYEILSSLTRISNGHPEV